MSYDLMVFDPEVAPRDRADFLEWYDDLTEWLEEGNYDSPEGMTGNLSVFYNTLRQSFPAMNGPHAVGEDRIDDPAVTDYSFAESAIYMTFAWSVAEHAYKAVVAASCESDVGFFDVSGADGTIAYDRTQLIALKERI